MPRPVCRFEYCYRDASNYKGYGSVLLWGEATPENEAAIRAVLIDGMYFEAERVGVPTLYHLVRGDSEADVEEDHGWHEFVGLVAAEELRLQSRDLQNPGRMGCDGYDASNRS
jgi:hypothetical protein